MKNEHDANHALRFPRTVSGADGAFRDALYASPIRHYRRAFADRLRSFLLYLFCGGCVVWVIWMALK